MRRGVRGGGGGRNARNNARPQMRDDIQDLDRELELLRRKRQLIEKQQRQYQPQYQPQQNFNSRGHTISPWEQDPQIRSNDYNQPRLSYNQLEFSNLYNSGQSYSAVGPSGFDSGPRTRKRPFNGSRRQDDPAGPKRFRNNRPASTGANFNPPKKFAPKVKPFQVAGGGSQFSNQSQNKSGPNKKKPFTSPNAKPADTRPSKPTQEPNSAPHKRQDKGLYLDYVIKDDVYRNFPKKVQGRIQYATGIIYKNLVARLETSGTRNTLFRHLKPLIYIRIYKALMNKEVGNFQNIIDLYNAAYPASTDKDLMAQAASREEDKAKGLQPRLDKSEIQNLDSQCNTVSAKDYFKINICEVMEKKLADMVTKLKQTYAIEYDLQETAKDGDNVDIKIEENNVETAAESMNDDETKPADAENTDDNAVGDQGANVTEGDDNAAAEESAADEEPVTVEGDTVEANESTEETKPMEADIEKEVGESILPNWRTTRNYHVTKVDELVKRELWRLLVRIKDGTSFFKELLAIMNMDPDFVKAKNDIAKAADEKRVEILNQPLHYVVLAGIPRLPKKIKLKGFLRHFNPTTIKKHRTVRNVLFIGFANPQDQADILNANDTIFENVKLSIKESKTLPNVTDAKEEKIENGADNDITEEDIQEINESLQNDGAEESFQADAEESFQADAEPVEDADKIIDTDIEGEINDLLTSMQESEGNPNDTTDNSEMIDDSGAANDGNDAQEGDEDEYQQDDNEQGGDIEMQESNDEQGGSGNVEETKDDKPQANGDNKGTTIATKLAASAKPALTAKPTVASKPAAAAATKPAVAATKAAATKSATAATKAAAAVATKPVAAATKSAAAANKPAAAATKAAVATPTKAAVATPTKTATRGAANTVQTRRSSRLP